MARFKLSIKDRRRGAGICLTPRILNFLGKTAMRGGVSKSHYVEQILRRHFSRSVKTLKLGVVK